ncbi:MAG: hypothetical protein NT004_02760 [Bacteroidetes bacterium]|nr:hypothetical protein [Bacteroidota bacterium]
MAFEIQLCQLPLKAWPLRSEQSGNHCRKRQNVTKANRLFQEALQIAGKYKLTADRLMLYREAFQSNLELHDVELALTYFKQRDHLNDSLKTIEQRDAVLKYQALYETQALETKVKDLNSHVRLQKIRNINIALILLALLLLVSTLVILLFFRNRQANQKRILAEQQALHSEQEKLLQEAELEMKTLEHQINEEKVGRLELEVNLKEVESCPFIGIGDEGGFGNRGPALQPDD